MTSEAEGIRKRLERMGACKRYWWNEKGGRFRGDAGREVFPVRDKSVTQDTEEIVRRTSLGHRTYHLSDPKCSPPYLLHVPL